MKFILVGQPNCGKSTIFNEVIGYKSLSSNMPCSTIEYTCGKIDIDNEAIDVIDLPGIYSLESTDEIELDALQYILNSSENTVIINVIDSSLILRSLELTLELMELQRPMIIALNMTDEAKRKGLCIDTNKLSHVLGVPTIETIANKGSGIFELFKEAKNISNSKTLPNIIKFSPTIEKSIQNIISYLKSKNIPEYWNYRFLSLKLIERNDLIKNILKKHLKPEDLILLEDEINKLENCSKECCDHSISSFRHNTAFIFFEKYVTVCKPKRKDIRDTIDLLLMHPVFGYLFLAIILYSAFWMIFHFGNALEPLFLNSIEKLTDFSSSKFGIHSLLSSISKGIIEGFGGGIGIVIPYLLPFFLFLSFIEDTGYLARIACLLDNLMHRIGLHGMSIIPIILGAGCSVPGILATRILKSKRDKFITATLTTLVPCSARMTIIFGLVGFFISIKAAILIYVITIIILGLTGKIMSKIIPEVSPGLIMEIPRYNLPGLKIMFKKTWFRLKEFVVIAWPILIIGSVILEFINYFHLTIPINSFLKPFTSGILGLPEVVGITLIFGLMRKELALVLLFAALGTRDVLNVMTQTQIFIYTVFATFYIPCLATVGALIKELKLKNAVIVTLLTFVIAIILSVLIRFIGYFFNI